MSTPRSFIKENVDHKIDLKLMDYRNLKGTYDKIISIEMLEAVGHKFYNTFFKKVNEVLAPKGLIELQVITSPHSRYKEFRKGIDWIQKHIFPGSLTLNSHNEPIFSQKWRFRTLLLEGYGTRLCSNIK